MKDELFFRFLPAASLGLLTVAIAQAASATTTVGASVATEASPSAVLIVAYDESMDGEFGRLAPLASDFRDARWRLQEVGLDLDDPVTRAKTGAGPVPMYILVKDGKEMARHMGTEGVLPFLYRAKELAQ